MPSAQQHVILPQFGRTLGAQKTGADHAKMGAVIDPESRPQKVETVRKLVQAGQFSPQLYAFLLDELLVCVDAKASDYREWLGFASLCAVRIDRPVCAALCTALASGPQAALSLLPEVGASRQRAYLLAAQAKSAGVDSARLVSEAAEQAQKAGLNVSAALFLGQVGKRSAAKELWLRLLGGSLPPYERALVHAQLALLFLRSDSASDAADGKRHAVLCGQILDEIADDYESQNQRALALDCYRVLSQLGEASGAFENVTEGYLGMLRIFKSERLVGEALWVYDELLRIATDAGEHEQCAEQCRDAAAFLYRCGLPTSAQRYLLSAADALARVADVRLRAGAVRLAEHALLSAADLLSTLSAPDRLHRVLEQLAALRSDVAERSRYHRLAELIDTAGAPARSDLGKPAAKSVETLPGSASQRAALPAVWSLDLLEWEANASPELVCLRLLLDASRPELTRRQALLALLLLDGADPTQKSEAVQIRLVGSLGSLRAYEAIAPLARLYHTSRATQPGGSALRVAILDVLPRLPFPRSLQLVVEALQDPALAVRSQAQASLARLGTVELLGPLGQILVDASDLGVKLAIVSALGRIADPRAVERLLQVFLQSDDPLRREARRGLVSLRDASLRPLYARALLSVSADRAQDLNILISELFPSGL